MPTWLVPTLKWGGIVLAIISAMGLIYVQMGAPAPAPETGEAVSEARTTLYWILLVIGVVGAIAGFVMDRRRRPT
jgi:ABC-type dipeptide/oligopeptide/nickel transport system permease subunit